MSGGHSRSKETRELLEAEGWVFVLAGNRHYKGTHPDAHRPIFLAATTSSSSSRVKELAKARRALRQN
jgi:hypothetical protein